MIKILVFKKLEAEFKKAGIKKGWNSKRLGSKNDRIQKGWNSKRLESKARMLESKNDGYHKG